MNVIAKCDQQWEATHAWEPILNVPYWVRRKYPSMNFTEADHYILTGKTYHYRIFDGFRVERSLKGKRGLVGRSIPKSRKGFLGLFK